MSCEQPPALTYRLWHEEMCIYIWLETRRNNGDMDGGKSRHLLTPNTQWGNLSISLRLNRIIVLKENGKRQQVFFWTVNFRNLTRKCYFYLPMWTLHWESPAEHAKPLPLSRTPALLSVESNWAAQRFNWGTLVKYTSLQRNNTPFSRQEVDTEGSSTINVRMSRDRKENREAEEKQSLVFLWPLDLSYL